MLASELGLRGSAPGCGSRTRTPFAFFDPASSSWRTSQPSLDEVSDEFCTTWPKQGTWDRGFAYELATSVPLTNESASSSLLPTPGANDSTGPEGATRRARQQKGKTGGAALRDITHLLPTPTSRDMKGASPGLKRRGSPNLDAAIKLLPTPTAQDAKQTSANEREAKRNPWTMWAVLAQLNGESTDRPSSAGSESSDGQLHFPQMNEDD